MKHEEKTCVSCNKTFIDTNTYVDVKTCSSSCARKLSWSNRKPAKTISINCLVCSKEVTFRESFYKLHPQKYCSNKCNGIANDTRVEVSCCMCGKKFKKRKDKILPKNYCSSNCVGKSKTITNAFWRDKIQIAKYHRIYRHHDRFVNINGESLITFTVTDWNNLIDNFGEKCMCCGSEEQITVDHIKPIYNGGANHISNIQVLCKKCNSSKGLNEIDYRPDDLKALYDIDILEV